MRKYIVFGASGDIGREIVSRLTAEGNEVIAHYHTNHPPEMEHVDYFQADLTTSGTIPPLGHVDGIIYAAGTAQYELFQLEDEASIDQQYQIHVKSLMTAVQQVLPHMIQQQFGRIIVISSIWGETGASMEVVYSTMKAAQLGFVKALAKEVALSNITVNAIAPGIVRGRMTDRFNDEELADILEEIPQGELVEPREVAAMVQFLLQEEAKHITGQVLRVNAGWLI